MPRGVSPYDEARLQGRLWVPAKGQTSYIPAAAASNLTNAFWGTLTGSAFTATANATTAPDGTQTASSLSNSGGGQYGGSCTIPGGTANKKFLCAVWMKSANGSNQSNSLKNTQGGVADNFQSFTVTPIWQEFLYTVTNSSSAGSGIQFPGFFLPSGGPIYAWNYRLLDVTDTFPFETGKLAGWSAWAQGLQSYLSAASPYKNRPPLIGG